MLGLFTDLLSESCCRSFQHCEYCQNGVRRYEKGSVILTTNKPFDGREETFGNDIIATAILDRLLHQFHIIASGGFS